MLGTGEQKQGSSGQVSLLKLVLNVWPTSANSPGLAFLCLTWAFFRLPEPRGRTYAELDILFEQKISARKFKKAVVDPFAIEQEMMEETTVEKTD